MPRCQQSRRKPTPVRADKVADPHHARELLGGRVQDRPLEMELPNVGRRRSVARTRQQRDLERPFGRVGQPSRQTPAGGLASALNARSVRSRWQAPAPSSASRRAIEPAAVDIARRDIRRRGSRTAAPAPDQGNRATRASSSCDSASVATPPHRTGWPFSAPAASGPRGCGSGATRACGTRRRGAARSGSALEVRERPHPPRSWHQWDAMRATITSDGRVGRSSGCLCRVGRSTMCRS